jgi:hypothetical protein
MPKSFIVAPLPPEHIDQAFPVVQPLRPAMTLAQWHAMAAPFAKPGASQGIVACRMGTGHIRGLFCYALHGAGELRVGPFAVAGLFDAHATAAGLIEAIDQLAHRFGGASVTVDIAACSAATVPRCDLPALFHEHGYRQEGAALVRDAVEARQKMPMAMA